MKQIFTLVLLVTISFTSEAKTLIRANTWYGNWSDRNSWSLGRIPQDGDSIVIWGGRGILVDQNITLNNIYINVTGTGSYLHLKGKLILNTTSVVALSAGSRIYAFGANRAAETISIGGITKYSALDPGSLYGFGIASRYTGVSPMGFSANAAMALPVQFLSFVAKAQGNAVSLTWSTAQEQDNSHFEIERSENGSNWKSIAIVFGNGTTSSVSHYSYTDKNTSATIYYRIRQVDQDGKSVYTSVKVIRAESNEKANIFASSKNTITVDLNSELKSNLTVSVLNLNGQVVAQQTFANASYKINMNVNTISGMYVVRVSDNEGFSQTKKLIL